MFAFVVIYDIRGTNVFVYIFPTNSIWLSIINTSINLFIIRTHITGTCLFTDSTRVLADN